MKRLNFLMLLVMALIVINGCKDETIVEDESTVESGETKRMSFYEYTYFLDYEDGISYVYQVDYDFQGLTGDAQLEPLVCVEGNAHLTVTPSTLSDTERSLVIINNCKTASKLYLVPISGDHPNIDPDTRYLAPEYGFDVILPDDASTDYKITQVDFNSEDHLFCAGTLGFFEAYYGTKSNRYINQDISLATLGTHSIYLKTYNINNLVATSDGETNYVAHTTIAYDSPELSGGDILFTQNSEETDGVESEVLISFTQWGDQAMVITLDEGTGDASAYKLFSLRSGIATYSLSSTENYVSGAALVGDNWLMTSHHNSSTFSVWNLAGEELATPTMVFPSAADLPEDWVVPADGTHNWGDMASYQRFDHSMSLNDDDDMTEYLGRVMVPEDIVDYGYALTWWPRLMIPEYSSHQNKVFAWSKLYVPNTASIPDYELNDDDNPVVDSVARAHSANADIIDLRKNANKFVSLGKKGGMLLMRFTDPFTVTETSKLQVVETSHDKEAEYATLTDAWSDYKEKAQIYVSDNSSTYVGSWKDDDSNWTYVGRAGIANNIFDIPQSLGEVVWVKIVDNGSQTHDGFDVNFVSAFDYDEEYED